MKPDDQFWDMARAFGRFLTSPATQRDALQNIGMLSYVPSDPPKRRGDGTGAETGAGAGAASNQYPTGWEAFFHAKYTRPPGPAMELSNLGRLATGAPGDSGSSGGGRTAAAAAAASAEVAGVRALAWAQRPHPGGAGLSLDLCGWEDTLSVSIGLRSRRFAPELQAALEHDFAPAFKAATLALLALPTGDEQDLSVLQLAELASAPMKPQ